MRWTLALIVLAACEEVSPPADALEQPDATPLDGGYFPDAGPDAAMPPDGAPPDGGPIGSVCATPPIGEWTGTARRHQQGSGSHHTMSADVTWTLSHTTGCIDHYVPSGTARYDFAAPCDITIEPAAMTIRTGDGELIVDRTTRPATYMIRGASTWPATITCDGEAEPSEVGGAWVDASGVFDAPVIDGVVRPADLLPDVTLEWHLRADDAPPMPSCAEPARDRWTFAGAIRDVAADITWARVGSDGCRDTFAPSGTVTVIDSCAGAAVSRAVGTDDGVLIIDRGESPPSFAISGATSWSATADCAVGGAWASFAGAFGGADLAGATDFHSWHYRWRLTAGSD